MEKEGINPRIWSELIDDILVIRIRPAIKCSIVYEKLKKQY